MNVLRTHFTNVVIMFIVFVLSLFISHLKNKQLLNRTFVEMYPHDDDESSQFLVPCAQVMQLTCAKEVRCPKNKR